MNQSAKDGFRAYIQAYASYSLKTIFDVTSLDLAKVARAFGFSTPPSVNINVGRSVKGKKKRKDHAGAGGSDDDDDESSEEEDEDTDRQRRAKMQRRGGGYEGKRRETEGRRGEEKDIYREQGREKLRGGNAGKQWSR